MQKQTGRLLRAFLGTAKNNVAGNTNLSVSATPAVPNGGFIISNGISLGDLKRVDATSSANTFGPGTFGFFDPETHLSVGTAPTTCCPLYLAAAPIYEKEFIGPLAGGYHQPIKTKPIDPKLIKRIIRFDPCTPQPFVTHIGQTGYTTTVPSLVDVDVVSVTCNGTGSISTNCSTPSTAGTLNVTDANGNPVSGATVSGSFNICDLGGGQYQLNISGISISGTNWQNGYLITGTVGTGTNTCTVVLAVKSVETSATKCCVDFLCDRPYRFRVLLRGTPVYQALNNKVWRDVYVHTGCCDPSNPTAIYVDPLSVYIQIAEQIAKDPILSKFIYPVVWKAGTYYYPPVSYYPNVPIPTGALTWADPTITFQPNQNTSFCGTVNGMVGLTLISAYVETRFKDCTFLPKDGYTYDVVQFDVQLVDEDGNKCAVGTCQTVECGGHTGTGIGESALRDIIHSEFHRGYLSGAINSYEDLRYREVAQGDQLLSYINRNARYYKYVIIYDYRRTEGNWVGIDPFEEWVVNIYTTAPDTAFEAFLANWGGTQCKCPQLEIYRCNRCDFENTDIPLLHNNPTPYTNV